MPTTVNQAVLGLVNNSGLKLGATASVSAEAGTVAWLKKIFPFLDAKVSVEAGAEANGDVGKEEEEHVTLRPISTPQRQLVQLAIHYALQLPDRTMVSGKSLPNEKWNDEFIQKVPRAMAFVDFPRGTKFIPTAVEVGEGDVIPLYPSLIDAFCGSGDRDPTYPEPLYDDKTPSELKKARREYWNFFDEKFSSTVAMECIEKTVRERGPIKWIDYRVLLGKNSPCLHLHVCGRGEWDTGVFAYGLVKRGYKHGLRVVGTLKSEPDLNVLAIFEK